MTHMIPFNRGNKRFVPVNNMLDDFFSDMWPSPRTCDFPKDTFRVDVLDSEEAYVIEADMPGVNRDEISLELSENTLSIQVKREEEKDESEKNYVHKERRFASMSRNIYLKDIKQDEIDAKLDNGVLTITVPKIDKSERVKQIDIK